MRDLQVSIVALHRSAAGFHSTGEPLVTAVRSASAFVQKLNDTLRTDIAQAGKYRRIFARRLDDQDPGVELIEGFRYIRNVISHRLVQVSPGSTAVVGGDGIGYRTFGEWAPVARRTHQQMHLSTQRLSSHYERHLLGNDVTDTLLDVARVFSELCPNIVHLNERGDWTGFPLRSQPAVASRLHPLEPELSVFDSKSLDRHQRWMEKRKPGGDFRVIDGLIDSDGEWVLGFTFIGHTSFTPFIETVAQIRADIRRGYSYFAPAHVDLTHNDYGPYRGGHELGGYSIDAADLERALGDPIDDLDAVSSAVAMPRDVVERMVRVVNMDYLTHRTYRLAATFPDWH